MDKICHYIDFNITNMQIKCKKYAEKYAQYAIKICKKICKKICRICISPCIATVLAYFANICTPHFADGESNLSVCCPSR